MCLFVCLIFFFSSRRRHTRLQGDWSSDVCSSDLAALCNRLRPGDCPAAFTVRSIGWWREARAARERRATRATWARRRHARSEERRVGEECRSRWSPDHLKKKKKKKQEER